MPILWLIAGSVLIGLTMQYFVGKILVEPMERLNNTFEELSRGNFSVRLPEDKGIKELRIVSKRFNSMVDDLAQIETLQNDFVVNVSHEFKTPIASIEGYATLLQEDNLTKEKHDRYVQKIIENSQRLSALSSNVLSLSKLENQEIVLSKSTYRLDEQIRKCVLMLESKWTEKNISFDIDLPKCKYYGNEALLEQVWFNIIDNAIKNSNNGGSIIIGIAITDFEVSVSISDNGCGMDEEVQKHLFEKFYQGDASRKSEGNGLGLAIVKRIVDLCNGKILVDSKLYKGTKFTIILPKEQ
jgi:signal transduction histidine kinase